MTNLEKRLKEMNFREVKSEADEQCRFYKKGRIKVQVKYIAPYGYDIYHEKTDSYGYDLFAEHLQIGWSGYCPPDYAKNEIKYAKDEIRFFTRTVNALIAVMKELMKVKDPWEEEK